MTPIFDSSGLARIIDDSDVAQVVVLRAQLESLVARASARIALAQFEPRAERLLSMREAAQRLGLSEDYVRNLGRDGVLPMVKMGRAARISERALDEFIREGGGGRPRKVGDTDPDRSKG